MYELRMVTPEAHWADGSPLTVQTVANGTLIQVARLLRDLKAAGWPEGLVILSWDGRVVTGA